MRAPAASLAVWLCLCHLPCFGVAVKTEQDRVHGAVVLGGSQSLTAVMTMFSLRALSTGTWLILVLSLKAPPWGWAGTVR